MGQQQKCQSLGRVSTTLGLLWARRPDFTCDHGRYIVETVRLDLKRFREGLETLMERLPDSMTLSQLGEGALRTPNPSSTGAESIAAPRAHAPRSNILEMII